MPATDVLAHSPLEPLLQKAGATMVARHGWWVAAHFGSPGGELALCDTAVGLADRSDLGKLELRGEAGRAGDAGRPAHAAARSCPGEALLAGGAWWCSVSPEHVIALCDAGEHRAPCAPRSPRPSAGRRASRSPTSRPATRRSGCSAPRTGALLDELSLELARATPTRPAFDVTPAGRASRSMLLRAAADPRGRCSPTPAAPRACGPTSSASAQDTGIGHVGADAVSHLSPLAR